MAFNVLAGPGCAPAGKESYFEETRTSDEDIFVDAGSLYRALAGRDDVPSKDPALLRVAQGLKSTAVRHARENGLDGVVTTSSGDRASLRKLAEEAGGNVLVLDPGREEMCRRIRRLVPAGARRELCEKGLARWYDRYQPDPGDIEVSGG